MASGQLDYCYVSCEILRSSPFSGKPTLPRSGVSPSLPQFHESVGVSAFLPAAFGPSCGASKMQIPILTRPAALAALVVATFLCVLANSGSLHADSLPDSVVDIRIEGNETIPSSSIRQHVKTQPGRQLTDRMIREDKRDLLKTRWFSDVTSQIEEGRNGPVLVYRVREKPIVRSVDFRGNDKIKDKVLRSWTGLDSGSPFDHLANQEAVHRIVQEYKEKGYFHIRVQLVKGGDPNDRDVVFQIKEGPVVRVSRRDFEGVEQVWDKRLETKLVTKESLFGLFRGIYRPETLAQDEAALLTYYRNLGFFDAGVKAEEFFSKDGASVRVLYTVQEGPRYRVGRILYEGNDLFAPDQIRKKPRVNEGDYFSSVDLTKDVREMLEPYWDRGHTYARIVPEPVFTEQTGVVDLKFLIDEDRQRYIRFVNPKISGESPYTQESVILDRLGLRPGDLADPRKINRARSVINGGGLFNGVQVSATPVNPETSMFTAGLTAPEERTFRGQQPVVGGHSTNWISDFTSASDAVRKTLGGHSVLGGGIPPLSEPKAKPQTSVVPAPADVLPENQFISYRCITPEYFERPAGQLLTPQITLSADRPVIRGQNPGDFLRSNPIFQGGPYTDDMQAVPPGWVDVEAIATEGRTGRLMFGAGVNSDNGIVGSFVWEENNFDLFNPPTSFADVLNGRAFRGKGQRFRLEAAPGDIVSRYAVNWVDQYFMNTDYSLSVSGFLYNRFFDSWTEERGGGRIGIGKQLSPTDSVSATFRLEEVVISNPRTPVPDELARALGSNFLSTVRLALTNDTRDAAIMPSEGHYLEGGFEQAFGDFDFSRLDLEGRKYYTLFRRPDDSGRQVLMLSTNLGFATNDTPVFDRYFAGGFQSFRGFAFRGVTPRPGGVEVGGTFQALATVEYRVPATADDMIHVVTFADIGTVDDTVTFDQFRATVGVGLRVTIPAMGQVPLAFDFGFPVASELFDDERIFSFYVGILN